MVVTSINFANKDFRLQQRYNTFTAKKLGGIDNVIEYSPDDIDPKHLEENKKLFEFSKGFGNYFWKPYLVKKTLGKLADGDYLVYADSGTVFLKSVRPIIEYMEAQKEHVMCFDLPLIERQWTKRDAFILMDCDSPDFTDTTQISANFFILKKSKISEAFIDKYLKYVSDYRIISAAENVMGKPNYPEFIAHRNDQSVLSLLCKKQKVLVERDVSDYGVFPHKYIHNDTYIYDETYLDTSRNQFKGTILANRKVHPLVHTSKYYVRLLLANMGIKT